MIFTHQETGFMEALSLKYKLYETYLQSYCSWSNGVIQNLPKMQGYLLQSKDRLKEVSKNKLSEGFFNNLICRYLYAKDYDQKESQ